METSRVFRWEPRRILRQPRKTLGKWAPRQAHSSGLELWFVSEAQMRPPATGSLAQKGVAHLNHVYPFFEVKRGRHGGWPGAGLAGLFLFLSGGLGHPAPIHNVKSYGAAGDGQTDDTAAINAAIAGLRPGSELFFPCGTYKVSAALTPIAVQGVLVAGSGSCTTIRGTGSGYKMMQIGSGRITSSTPFDATAEELDTSFFADFARLGGVARGDFVILQEGGRDYSNDTAPGHDLNCDVSGCRGEVLVISSVSGSKATVTTALHYRYDPVTNGANVAKLISPIQGAVVRDISFDGSGTVSNGLFMAGVANSTVSNVSAHNFVDWGLLSYWSYNLAWNNVEVTHSGNGGADAFLLHGQGKPRVNGATVSNLNLTAFGFGMHSEADGTITALTVDKSGSTTGRAFKLAAASYNTFNGIAVKNGMESSGSNGISIVYYSSHNTFNDCLVVNNSSSAGIMSFGNYNQYNTFVNCTVNGNAGWQLGQGASALGQTKDDFWEIRDGTYSGTGHTIIQIVSNGVYIHDVRIVGPGSTGVHIDGNQGCINNNVFTGPLSAHYDIQDAGVGNLFNSNDTPHGTHPASLPQGPCPARTAYSRSLNNGAFPQRPR